MDEFYIGYLPEAPSSTSKFIRNILVAVFILVLSAGIILSLHQREFSKGVFEYGSKKEYTGVYTNVPVPSIKIVNQKDSSGKDINMTIPIVGYGKHGAESAIENYEIQHSVSLNGKKVTFKGDLIYNEKTFLSLVDDNPITHVTETNESADKMMMLGDTTLQGEIIDPKCYFGVMKPGLGKVHRQCAINCISGGIPPVIRTQNRYGTFEYFLLLGKNGERINQEVLFYVADPIELKGKLYQWGNWKVFQCDLNSINRIK